MKYLIFLVLLGIANAYVVNFNEVLDQLQPVQGLYVKPSSDGVTGDLYMAATEDNGAQSSWAADQPINFFTSPNLQPAASLPMTYSAGIAPATTHDDTAVQQRSVANYPVNYAYGAMPMSSHGFSSYAYAIPSFATAASNHASLDNPAKIQSAEGGASTAVQRQPQYTPMPFFYPGIMSAAATAYNSLKDGSSKEEAGNVSHQAQMWSPAYPYPPVQYVMVDPSTWAASVYGTPANGAPVVEVQKE